VLIVTPDAATLYVEASDAEQALTEVSAARVVETPSPLLIHAVKSLRYPRRAGFEANNLAFGAYEDLQKALPDTEMVGLRRVVESLRAVKDADELERNQQAAAITDRVLDEFFGWCRPGQSEKEVAAWLEHHLRLAGGERLSSGLLGVASGRRTTLPHPAPTD